MRKSSNNSRNGLARPPDGFASRPEWPPPVESLRLSPLWLMPQFWMLPGRLRVWLRLPVPFMPSSDDATFYANIGYGWTKKEKSWRGRLKHHFATPLPPFFSILDKN